MPFITTANNGITLQIALACNLSNLYMLNIAAVENGIEILVPGTAMAVKMGLNKRFIPYTEFHKIGLFVTSGYAWVEGDGVLFQCFDSDNNAFGAIIKRGTKFTLSRSHSTIKEIYYLNRQGEFIKLDEISIAESVSA